MQEQREAMTRQAALRAEVRAAVEQLQRQIEELTAERQRLAGGGAVADIEARRAALEDRMARFGQEEATLQAGLGQHEEELRAAQAAEHEAGQRKAACVTELSEEQHLHAQAEFEARATEAAAEAATARLKDMVDVSSVQRCEAEAREYRDALRSLDRESRQLRVALAEALSSGADLPNALRELEVLRESTEVAVQRVRSLEELNEQFQGRVEQLEAQVARLRMGAVDLRSEEDLMREVIIQQSEHLLRRVEDLTEERKTAAADRQQLLATAADLAAQVDTAEARLGRRPKLETECQRLEAGQQALTAEVQRLRRTNEALREQVLGEEAEGPLSGALSQTVRLGDDEIGEALRAEIGRLVCGQPLLTSQGSGGVRADAAALALRLQQLLAEREEAFWVERQRLSDRVMALERVRPGRTGNLLRQYDAAARGTSSGLTGSGSGNGSFSAGALAAAPAAAAAAMTGGFRKLRETMGA